MHANGHEEDRRIAAPNPESFRGEHSPGWEWTQIHADEGRRPWSAASLARPTVEKSVIAAKEHKERKKGKTETKLIHSKITEATKTGFVSSRLYPVSPGSS
jgi:hypothetical protein